MHDEQSDATSRGSNPDPAAGGAPPRPDWVAASGVSGEHVLAGERAPRLHWALMILGPIGLAIAIALSLWSSSRQVERSVNIQVETTWVPGEQLALRTQILAGDLKPLAPKTAVSLAVVDGEGQTHALTELDTVAPGLGQGRFVVPELAPGEATLIVHYEPAQETKLEPFDERVPITVVAQRNPGAGHQVVSEHILQWADDTDEQPPEARIDVRPAERLLAGFDNLVFVRVTDPAGKPWAPSVRSMIEEAGSPNRPAQIQVLLISGEFGGQIGKPEDPPVLYQGPLDELGLAQFFGVLTSDVVRFEVRLLGEADVDAPPARDFTGPKRRLRFVSHAGTVRMRASTDFARPGDVVTLAVEAISARKPVFVDVHGLDGAWIDTFTPPLQAPQEREWKVPREMNTGSDQAGAVIQFEAYQSTLRPEDSSALARVQLVAPNTTRVESVAPLIERQRRQLSLPRLDKQFEIGRERAYLSEIEARVAQLDEAAVDRTRAFLLGSLEAVVHGPTQALNTRAREDEDLLVFKRWWVLAVRWFLLGGGGLFILTMTLMVWRDQRSLERQTNQALGLGSAERGGSPIDEELFADQSIAIVRARRQVLARGAFTIGLMVAALILTVAMLESLVWKY